MNIKGEDEVYIVEPNDFFAISVMTRKVAIAGRAYVGTCKEEAVKGGFVAILRW